MAGLIGLREKLRLDLKDPSDERWTDALFERHIEHALAEFSQAIPFEDRITMATVSSSREVDISSLSDRVMIEAVEYPIDRYPVEYVRFAVWGDTLTLLLDTVPDGSNCRIYYGRPHTAHPDWQASTAYSAGTFVMPTALNGYRYECTAAGTSDATEPTWGTTLEGTTNDGTAVWTCRAETFSPQYDELIILGAGGFALLEWADYVINQVNVGGKSTHLEYQREGQRRLGQFRLQIKRLGKDHRVRNRQLYTPQNPIVSRFKVQAP